MEQQPAIPGELKRKLMDAVESGKYFITISYKNREGMIYDLKHYWTCTGFPVNEVENSIDFVKDDFIQKEILKRGEKSWE